MHWFWDMNDSIRRLGVALAVVGLLIVAPDSPRDFWPHILKPFFARWIAGLRPRPDPRGRVAIVNMSGTAGGAGPAPAWTPLASVDQQLTELRNEVERLFGVAGAQRDALAKQALEMVNVAGELRGLIAATNREHTRERERERTEARALDARGFVPILLGTILGGLPDELAAWAPSAWVSIGAGFVVLVPCVVILRKHWWH
jgi:hypothetical protein